MERGIEIETRMRALRELLGLKLRAMARAMNASAGTYANWERPGRGTYEATVHQHVKSLVASIEIPAREEERWVERVMAFLFARANSPWDGERPAWKVGCDPTKRPGRKSGGEWAGARARHEGAFRAVLKRLSAWSRHMDRLGRVEPVDELTEYGVMLVADLEDAFEGREPAVRATVEEAEQELQDFKAAIKDRLKKAGRKLIFNDFRGPRAPEPAMPDGTDEATTRRTPCASERTRNGHPSAVPSVAA